MKIKLILCSAIVILMASCTQTTCPAYTKGYLDQEKEAKIEREQV